MDNRSSIFVAGHWVRANGRELVTVIDPSTEQCIATVPECDSDDVDAAVDGAVRARSTMRALSIEERSALLLRLADELELRRDELTQVISAEMGMPVRLCREHQVDSAVAVVRTTAAALARVVLREPIGHSCVVREPVGVVAAITPWNYPLLQSVSKFAPAFAAGCPLVLKPSELAPLDAFVLAEAVEAAGLPPGAFNLVLGTGASVGEALVRHPAVAMVSLTGSTRAGRRVSQLAGADVKPVALELGGKSASVVLRDGDLAAAVEHCVDSVMINTGQSCTALSRLLVPFQDLGGAEELVAEAMGRYRIGPGQDPDVDVGPLANTVQLQRVNEHVERAQLDGLRSIYARPPEELPDKGSFVSPMAFTVVDPAVPLAQEEVFGPVLAVIPYVDESDAVTIANSTNYGLSAAVWSADEEHAVRVAEQIEAGTVDVNGAPFNGEAPFGGYKQSGHGRELGRYGIEEFTHVKAIQRPVPAGRR